jgi:hypothetical protein
MAGQKALELLANVAAEERDERAPTSEQRPVGF